jgi:uncharacterized protein YjbI with pentapeptide repeats
MKRTRHLEGKKISTLDLSGKKITDWDFSSCRFESCNFSNSKLHKCQFYSCEFIECDLSNVILGRSQFIDINLTGCKILGIDWGDAASPLKLSFHKCMLDYNIFVNRNLKGLVLTECLAREVFFQSCDLTKSSFIGSDLSKSQFELCKLNYADLTDVINLNISPENNDISNATLSIDSALMLLSKYCLTIR